MVCWWELSPRHVFETCAAVRAAREKTGIASFVAACESANVPAYHLYVGGKDPNLCEVPLPEYLDRGAALLKLQSSWLELIS